MTTKTKSKKKAAFVDQETLKDSDTIQEAVEKTSKKIEKKSKVVKSEKTQVKKCSSCERILSVNNFPFAKISINKLFSYCKDCCKEKNEKIRKKYLDINNNRNGYDETINEKTCNRCDKMLSINNFAFNKLQKDGYSGHCKICQKNNIRNICDNNKEVNIRRGGYDTGVLNQECCHCKVVLPILEFNFNIRRKNGYAKSCRNCSNKRRRDGYKNDINVKTKCLIRSRFFQVLKNNKIKKSKKINKYGIDIDEIINHIGEKPEGNYDLDHIFPVSAFDHTNEQHIKACWNKENLMWLESGKNKTKFNNYDKVLFEQYLNRFVTTNKGGIQK